MNTQGAMSSHNEDAAEGALLLHHDKNAPPAMSPEQAAAMMAHYGGTPPPYGYYGDAAAFAAHAGGVPPPQFWYPPPQGYPPVGPPQGQGFYAPQHQQPFVLSNPYAPPPQAARPPRSQRRSSGARSSPSPTNSRKTFSELALEDGERDRSSIPPLGDIFSDAQPLLQSAGQGGYGATAAPQAPKVYNAPPRVSTISANVSKAAYGIPRTNSAGDFNKHPLKSNGPGLPSHRRISSDVPLRAAHRRVGSSDELPPSGHRRTGSRSRSYSATGKPTHRRGDSASSFKSNLSMASVVSNISKSEFFGGVDEKGRVQMHFPFEAIRLVMIDPEKPALRRGHLYLDGHVGDFEQFEEYHRLTDGANDGIFAPQWESLDKPGNLCGCTCNNCNGCLGKKHLLPQANYMLAVDDNVYKRVVGEIADAYSMPCGLFFCGHHEDVAYPSILIAVFLVTLLLGILFYLAVKTGDMSI